MTKTRVRDLLLEAKKALGALVTMEAAAVSYGVIDDKTGGLVLAVAGILAAGVVYVLNNEEAPEPDGQGSV